MLWHSPKDAYMLAFLDWWINRGNVQNGGKLDSMLLCFSPSRLGQAFYHGWICLQFGGAKVDFLDVSPFEADLGWNTKTPIKLLKGSHDESLQSVTKLTQSLQESIQNAKVAKRFTHARQAAYNSKKYQPSNSKVGDKVFLSRNPFTDFFSTARPFRKLSVRCNGPFKVIGIINKNEIRQQLPDRISIHLAVHVEHTRKVNRQLADISFRLAEPGAPFMDDTGETVIEVSEILVHKKSCSCLQLFTVLKDRPRLRTNRNPSEILWILKERARRHRTLMLSKMEFFHTCINRFWHLTLVFSSSKHYHSEALRHWKQEVPLTWRGRHWKNNGNSKTTITRMCLNSHVNSHS